MSSARSTGTLSAGGLGAASDRRAFCGDRFDRSKQASGRPGAPLPRPRVQLADEGPQSLREVVADRPRECAKSKDAAPGKTRTRDPQLRKTTKSPTKTRTYGLDAARRSTERRRVAPDTSPEEPGVVMRRLDEPFSGIRVAYRHRLQRHGWSYRVLRLSARGGATAITSRAPSRTRLAFEPEEYS
jgi:hypothetical protein